MRIFVPNRTLFFFGSLKYTLKQKRSLDTLLNRSAAQNSNVPLEFRWKSRDDQKAFFDDLASKLGISTPRDWGRISKRKVFQQGGGGLLSNYYGSSLFKALKNIYPEVEWKREWFQYPPNYWKSKENQRHFFDELATEFGIKEPKEWGKITVNQVAEKGGRGIIFNYGSSLFRALQGAYPEVEWTKEWFHRTKVEANYWKNKENQRNLFDKLADDFQIKKPSDWGTITYNQIASKGGDSLVNEYYSGSVFRALKGVYPEISWDPEWFVHRTKVPSNHWKSKENQRNFFDKLAITLGIKEPSDWGKITKQELASKGAAGLLLRYDGSVLKALQGIYPEISWNIQWFEHIQLPQRYWKDKSNQRNFFEEIRKEFGIEKDSDWGKLTLNQISQRKGKSLLTNYYNNSLFSALKGVYPEVSWNPEWFRVLSYWKDTQSHRKFFDDFAKELGIKHPSEWGKVTISEVHNSGVLSKYGYSLFRALKSVYPEISWEVSWFNRVKKFPHDHWNNLSNQKSFLDEIIQNYSKSGRLDLRLIKSDVIKSGGSQLLKAYNGNIQQALKKVLPNLNLELQTKILSGTSKSQTLLLHFVKKWFLNTQVISNYKHPNMFHLRNNVKYNIELDIWIPTYNLAFEFQGEQHFNETFFSKSFNQQIKRDFEKRDQCTKYGITLIEVPYWWNSSELNVLHILIKKRPDLLSVLELNPEIKNKVINTNLDSKSS